jgi:dGTPase
VSLLRRREAYEQEELERLAPFAAKSALSRGRVVPEAEHPYRTAFQRDRDRVIHARAFRRLEYKTQVFVRHEGDHYRNRLTHTLEGAQIARTIARALRLNEDLAEAIILAHDLGHTPFGHAGERVLDGLLEDDGGFDHNRQSLRVVDLLEERYPSFRGLNLTSETREGILKHGVHWEHPVALPPETPSHSLEAQLADLSDEIAYTNHDLDDGLRAELLKLEGLADVELWREARRSVEERMGAAPETVLRAQTIITLLDGLVTDLIATTCTRLEATGAASIDDVRALAEPCVSFSAGTLRRFHELKHYLFDHFYMHPRVLRMNERAEPILGDLFRGYRTQPRRLPEHVSARFPMDGEARAIADYIAGMTDRFASAEQRRLKRAHDSA